MPTSPSAQSRRPMATRLPSIVAAAPHPGTVTESYTYSKPPSPSLPPRASAAETSAVASGWRTSRSAAAARRSSAASSATPSAPPATKTLRTRGAPSVSVPVLSRTTTPHDASASSASPERNSTPRFAARLVATSVAVGVASPRAHGQAQTRTSTARRKPTRAPGGSADAVPNDAPVPVAAATAAGNMLAPAVAQNASVAAAAAATPHTKGPAAASANLCTGAAFACASSTRRATLATCVSAPAAEARTDTGAPHAMAPALTTAPSALLISRPSPVRWLSSNDAAPRSTVPSTGTRSPGSTRTTSPVRIAPASTSTTDDDSSNSRCATLGSSSAIARRSPPACRRARSSSARPSRMNASSMTGSSRNAEAGRPSDGTARPATPAPKDVDAPRPTRLFIFGRPATKLL
mmetsp:Transcript_7502/g.19587  ORF Transcript_7502/g.19587 Transcript_7502/m.19587 type:complete len:407 (-) Transcript_7502:854-2074(-)